MASAVLHRARLYLDLIRWSRPAGWLLLLWPTLTALWIAARGFPGWLLVAVFAVGTVLMRSAGCCINDVADYAYDKHVQRTAQRPVTSGALSRREALAVGAVLALLAFGLVLQTNALTVQWSFAALAIAIAYPYSKRFFAMPQAVLGLAFSAGIPMAFAAVQGQVPLVAGYLVVCNLFWVLAYDTQYAMVDRDDDLRIGIQTSAITLGRFDVAAIALFYALHLAMWAALLVSLPGVHWGIAGLGWVIASAQAAWHVYRIRHRSRTACFAAFAANHWIGCSLFVATVLAYGL